VAVVITILIRTSQPSRSVVDTLGPKIKNTGIPLSFESCLASTVGSLLLLAGSTVEVGVKVFTGTRTVLVPVRDERESRKQAEENVRYE
jgi:hypothetical protein